MEKIIALVIIGVILIVLGIRNFRGNISSIHWYNRKNVSEDNILSYGKYMGTGTLIIGLSLIVTALLEFIFNTDVFDFITLVGCIAGFVIMLYGLFKYNKGIF